MSNNNLDYIKLIEVAATFKVKSLNVEDGKLSVEFFEPAQVKIQEQIFEDTSLQTEVPLVDQTSKDLVEKYKDDMLARMQVEDPALFEDLLGENLIYLEGVNKEEKGEEVYANHG